MLDTVILDMDGVLVDSEIHWRKVEFDVLKSIIPDWDPDQHQKIRGMSVGGLYAWLTSQHSLRLQKSEFTALYHRMAERIYRRKTNLLPGCREFLASSRNQSFKLAVASSSPSAWIQVVMRRFKLAESFEVIVSAEDVKGAGKPAPDIYIYTAKNLQRVPENCVVIEDSENGVLAAKRAAMKCVGVRNGDNDEQDLSQADHIVHGFAELSLDIVKNL